MNSIYVPSSGPDAWRAFLAKPSLHWATGRSARTLAHSWEEANGLPTEIRELLRPVVGEVDLLLALPEHKTPLPGGRRDSQSDVFALVRSQAGLITMTVEGKVDEPFGPTVAEWLVDAGPGKVDRLAALQGLLGLSDPLDGAVRYQLLHRTAAAVIEAGRFATGAAAMVVHSFSPEARWFSDYARFAELLGCSGDPKQAQTVPLANGKPLYIGWAQGDARFLTF